MFIIVRIAQTESVKKSKLYQEFVKTIAANIKRLRKQRNLTQEDMAEQGFNYRHYQKLESGTYSPNLQTLHRLMEVFDVDAIELFKSNR